LNGKKNDWEAVVEIPFINPARLLAAMRTREAGLAAYERKRNVNSVNIFFEYWFNFYKVDVGGVHVQCGGRRE
jgi:5'-3' exonuclease